jgi:hypothetical protein
LGINAHKHHTKSKDIYKRAIVAETNLENMRQAKTQEARYNPPASRPAISASRVSSIPICVKPSRNNPSTPAKTPQPGPRPSINHSIKTGSSSPAQRNYDLAKLSLEVVTKARRFGLDNLVKPTPELQKQWEGVQCVRCEGKGHIASACPSAWTNRPV